MRTLVVGDIHGNLDAFKDVLKISRFDAEEDRLICIGDYIDGWESSFEVVQSLLEIKNQSNQEPIYLLGNHDSWFLKILNEDFEKLRDEEYIKKKYFKWYHQGGKSTYDSYLSYSDELIKAHKEEFFDNLVWYYKEENTLFVHAGFDETIGFDYTLKNNKKELIWNRSLYRTALNIWNRDNLLKELGQEISGEQVGEFDKIFIGHTPTINDGFYKPQKMGNVINIDQGCKKNGILTIWELETSCYYQNVI